MTASGNQDRCIIELPLNGIADSPPYGCIGEFDRKDWCEVRKTPKFLRFTVLQSNPT